MCMCTITPAVCTRLFFRVFILPSVVLREAENIAGRQGYIRIFLYTVQLPCMHLVLTKHCVYMFVMFIVDFF